MRFTFSLIKSKNQKQKQIIKNQDRYNKFENVTTRTEKETLVHYLSALVPFVYDKMH